MSLPPARSWLFGFNCWLAAMLALALSFSCELRNPWWAMLTVFITSQPVAGAVASKAVYRVLGTLAGVCASLLIVPNLVDAPELMILAIALWIGLCLYLSLLKRGPEGYALMLAGYTIALVGLPPLSDPYGIFDIAVARAEEIVIGVLSAVLVHGLLFPRSAESVVVAKLGACLRDAQNWIVAALALEYSGRRPTDSPLPSGGTGGDPARSAGWGEGGFPEQQARKRLASDLTDLSLLAAHLPFEPLARHSAVGVMRALEQRMIGLLPLLSAVEDRLAALAACGPVPEPIARLVAELRDWVAHGDPVQAARLIDEARAAMPEAGPGAAWAELLTVSLLERIEELVGAWRDSLELARLLREPRLEPSAQLLPRIRRAASRVLHIDHGLAALSGCAAACGVLAAGAFAMVTNWSEGFTAVSIAGVLSCLFATADDPTPMLRRMLVWTLLAIPVAMLYVFAILPAIDGFPLLALVLLPLLLPVGAFMSMPQHGLRALAFAIGVSAGIALQPRFGSDFVGFAVGNVGVVIGTVTALLVTGFIRVVRGEANARRILGAGWRELAGLATDRTPLSREAWASRMLDRLALLLPRLAQADPAEGLHLSDALNDLRLGVNIVDLRAATHDLPRWPFTQVERLMTRFAAHFRNISADGLRAPDESLRRQLDLVIAELLRVENRELRLHGLAAGVGLRRNLFPAAAAFTAIA